MNKIIRFAVLALTLIPVFCFGQKDTAKMSKLYVYQTADDFFTRKSRYLGKAIERNDTRGIFKYYDKNLNKVTLHLTDSAIFGFRSWEGLLYFDPTHTGSFHIFCGGSQNYNIYAALQGSGMYDKDGFLKTETYSPFGNNTDVSYNYTEFWYNDNIRKISSAKIEDVLDKDLLAKYLAEKEATSKKDWKKEKHAIAFKYFKLYVLAHG